MEDAGLIKDVARREAAAQGVPIAVVRENDRMWMWRYDWYQIARWRASRNGGRSFYDAFGRIEVVFVAKPYGDETELRAVTSPHGAPAA